MERQLEELRAKMERSGMALVKFERELDVINPEEKPIFFLRGCCSSIRNTPMHKPIGYARKPPITPRAEKP